MLEEKELQLMYVHAVCDMYSKSSAFISALVIILRYGTQLLIVETFKIRWSVYFVQELSEYYLLNKMYITYSATSLLALCIYLINT